MGAHWPSFSPGLVPPALGRAREHARLPAREWLIGAVWLSLLSGALLFAWQVGELTRSLWLGPPVLAAVAWSRSVGHVSGQTRAAFGVLAMAAVVAAAGWLLGGDIRYWLAGSSALVALGAGMTLAPVRHRARTLTLTIDLCLLVLAGLVATSRLTFEPLLRSATVPGEVALGVSLQAMVLVPSLVAALVVLRRGSALAPRSAVLLLLATWAMAGWSLHYLSVQPPAPLVSGAALQAWAAVWLFYGWSGLGARRIAPTPGGMLAGRRAHDRLRGLIVPGVALFLAAAVLEMGFGPRPATSTVVGVALLAVVLGLRTTHALRSADREADHRRQLAHTRALVSVTHALAGTTDLDEALLVISDTARSVFGTRGAGVELITEDGASLETRSAVGMPSGIVGLRFPIEGSFTGWVVRHGEPRATTDPSSDPYIQPQSLDFLGRWPVAAAPIRFRGETWGAIFACIRTDPFDAEELHLLGALAEQAAIAIQNAQLFEQVMVLSVTDPLTGLANRRQLERELSRDFAAARRGRDLVAVMFDLDEFKQYNDRHGHLAGDEALQAFARALQEETRAMNLPARYGGDEFVALLSETDLAGARGFVARVQRRFQLESEALGRRDLTLSVGMAAFTPDMTTPDELLRAADNALYRNKSRVRT